MAMELNRKPLMHWSLLLACMTGKWLEQPAAWAQNQIVPDGTLGAEQSVITPFNADIDLISGGAVREQNLFHSFLEFNVGNGNGAYFITNTDAINNIFARITGGSLSVIQGTLGTRLLSETGFAFTDANLYLINPNGILFGEGAALDIGGSFTATTASTVRFFQSGEFSALNPEVPSPLLTVNPSSYFFSSSLSGEIVNRSFDSSTARGLQVPDGSTLTLLGGDITIDGGSLTANGGRIELLAVAGDGSASLNENGSLLISEEAERRDITIDNDSFISSISNRDGEIEIAGRNINILGGSIVGVGIDGTTENEGSQAGSLSIQATENIRLDSQSLTTNQVIPGGAGKAGNINITARNLEVTNNARLLAGTFGNGDAGNLLVEVQDGVSINDGGSIANLVDSNSVGSGGDIILRARSLEVEDRSRINATTFGQGDAGDIDIQVVSLEVADGSQILSTTEGKGNAGTLAIKAQDEITLLNSLIITEVTDGLGEGNGGDITIEARTLEILDGSAILADTENLGNAGNITISARERVTLAGEGPGALDPSSRVSSQISATVEEGAIGEGGNIEITTGNLSMADRAFINASTSGQGSAGDITIHVDSLEIASRAQISSTTGGKGNAGTLEIRAQGQVTLLNSLIITEVIDGAGEGNGGNINIEARTLEVLDGSAILADTENLGDAGNIIISAAEKVILTGEGPGALDPSSIVPSQISATVEERAIGEGGDIEITTGNLSMSDRAFINTSTFGQGSAGNIVLRVNQFEAKDGAQLSAFTSSSKDAGTISITAHEIVLISGRDEAGSSGITSASFGQATGNGGAIVVASPTVLVLSGATVSSISQGLGDGGSIEFLVNRLEVSDGSIEANSSQSRGGNISVNGSSINPRGVVILHGDGDITSDSFGDGGNITLNSIVIAFDDSDILARSADAQGGDITLGPFFSQTIPLGAEPPTESNDRVDVSADGQLASGVITTPDTDVVQNSLGQLPVTYIDPTTLISGSCIARSDTQGSFVVTGGDGTPSRPGDALLSSYPTGGVQPSSGMQAAPQIQDTIVEPTGVFPLADGRLLLSRVCE